MAETYDGTTWSVVPTTDPDPPGDQFDGVSCTSSTFCVAVGGGNTAGFAEQWDGTQWTTMSLPVLGSSFGLGGVSCTSPTWCVAAGAMEPPGGNGTGVALEWDGSAPGGPRSSPSG
ncbi:MAG TPA: hypothetical protein VEH82_09330 [Acidimicrobiales bacterium]|nr:hypothetical protein [Acidimicrobiales bacterium]